MINVRALNRLLTDNADKKLFPRWFIMTPNGALIAYTTPADIRELRDQVALVSMTWKEQLDLKTSEADDSDFSPRNLGEAKQHSRSDAVETLTIEFEKRNLIVRYLQPKLLLVLEGGVPPSQKRQLKITVETPGDPRYPPEDQSSGLDASEVNGADGEHDSGHKPREEAKLSVGSPSAASQASTAFSSQGRKRQNVLHVHRRKLDVMAKTIKAEFERSGFEMPDDLADKSF